MFGTRLVFIALAVVSVVFIAAGCSGSTGAATSVVGSDIVFGRGSVPDTVPESFPIPEEAVVGATLVDAGRGLTEMIVMFPADTAAVVAYYGENLPLQGYEITRSEGSETEWGIDFAGESVDGAIRVQTEGIGIVAATVQFTTR
jgi:hypothetical protein